MASQLLAKRSELSGLVDDKLGDLNAILKVFDHIDPVIRIFTPETVAIPA